MYAFNNTFFFFLLDGIKIIHWRQYISATYKLHIPHFEMHEIVIMNLEHNLSSWAELGMILVQNAMRDVGDSRDWMCDIRVN